MIGVIVAGFAMITLNNISSTLFELVLLKYALQVSLPGGIIAQAAAADSQLILVEWGVIVEWASNLNVSNAQG